MDANQASQSGSRLEAVERLAIEAGAQRLANEARALSVRVRDGLFYVACVGQFKRGKSTLLNALLGASVLPVGVVPVTAVVTIVRYSERRWARVRFVGGGWEEVAVAELAQYVTEEQNPENRKGVEAVEVFVPSELLASGLCLVDTPGIGSVFLGNTEATRAFLPHVDAALVVLGADPPISGEELRLVQDIASRCTEVFFALNKADKLSDAELDQGDKFTRGVLAERAALEGIRLFRVSAAERLQGQGPARDWPGLVDALGNLARHSRSDLVQAAEERGFASISERLLVQLNEEEGALLRPIEESELRVEALFVCVSDADRALSDLDYLFAAEQARLARTFSESRERFLEHAIPAARQEFITACRSDRSRRGPALRRVSVKLAREVAMRHLDSWLADAEPMAEQLYAQAMERFVEVSDDFLSKIKDSGDAAMASLPSSVDADVGLRWDSRLFYKDLFLTTGEGPVTWAVDLFRTRESTLRSVERVVGDYLVRLLKTNATRIENDLNERVLESRRRLAFELRGLLRELVDSARSSLERAKSVQERGSKAVREEVDRIGRMRERLNALPL